MLAILTFFIVSFLSSITLMSTKNLGQLRSLKRSVLLMRYGWVKNFNQNACGASSQNFQNVYLKCLIFLSSFAIYLWHVLFWTSMFAISSKFIISESWFFHLMASSIADEAFSFIFSLLYYCPLNLKYNAVRFFQMIRSGLCMINMAKLELRVQ